MYKEQVVGSYKKTQILENNTYLKLSLMYNSILEFHFSLRFASHNLTHTKTYTNGDIQLYTN